MPSRDGRLRFKVESANPTGSFKDRGAAVLLTAARTTGARALVEDSSGNAGAAIAAYATRADLEATIYVPEAASPGKLAQLSAYGARVVRVAGSREEVAEAAHAAPGRYTSHCWDPIFFHGTKTIAYELWESLGGRAPDYVVTPVGHGTMLLGLWLGFQELTRRGAIAADAEAPRGPERGLRTSRRSRARPQYRDGGHRGRRDSAFASRCDRRRSAGRSYESGGRFLVVEDSEILEVARPARTRGPLRRADGGRRAGGRLATR